MARIVVSLVLGLVVCAGASSLEAQDEITTDRPDLSSTVVEKGSLQLENGLGWTRNDGRTSLDGMETVLRLGLVTSGELRVAFPTLYSPEPGAGGGFTDIVLDWKQQLTRSSSRFQLSLAPGLSLPTGSGGHTTGGFDPQLAAAWSKDIYGRWSTSGVQYVFYSTDRGRHFLEGETVLAIERGLTRRADAYIEYQGSLGHFGLTRLLEIGAFYRNRPNHQWDFLLGVGLNRRSQELSLGVGFSFRVAAMGIYGGRHRP